MKTTCMNEKEILTDILNNEKQLVNLYGVAITECSCPNLRKVLTTQFEQTSQDQFNVFKEMSTRGFYPTKDAQDTDVQSAKQEAKTMMGTLNC